MLLKMRSPGGRSSLTQVVPSERESSEVYTSWPRLFSRADITAIIPGGAGCVCKRREDHIQAWT